jgi:hypothetical protein
MKCVEWETAALDPLEPYEMYGMGDGLPELHTSADGRLEVDSDETSC